MIIGIDKIGFATTKYMLELDELAKARGQKSEKYKIGLMLDTLSISPINEDIVTMAAAAAQDILTDDDKQHIDMIIMATESSIDQSKASSIYVHSLLNIQPFTRCIEIKEACYAATAGLDYAKLHIATHPNSRVLVIASDIAKYGISSSGESTQGAGAIAMLITAQPRILALSDDNLAQTRNIMDFWRPNYATTPYVDGMYSTKQYLDSLKTTWVEYKNRNQVHLTDFAAICLHLPYPKLALKGLNKIIDKDCPEHVKQKLNYNFDAAITYSRQIGNIYTGSLYLGLLSLLENSSSLKAGDKIALFSYGSGAVSEMFSATLIEGYEKMLQTDRSKLFKERIPLTVKEYEKIFYEEAQIDDNGNAEITQYKTKDFTLAEIKSHQRIYERVAND